MNIINSNNRTLVVTELKNINNKYYIDFNDFERKIIENDIKMFILCSPHNPVGRVWTKNEINEIGRICIKHNVIIVSDEIHLILLDSKQLTYSFQIQIYDVKYKDYVMQLDTLPSIARWKLLYAYEYSLHKKKLMQALNQLKDVLLCFPFDA